MHSAHSRVGLALNSIKGAHGRFEDRKGLTILGWHRISDLRDGLSVSRSEFEAQLDLLVEAGACVLPLGEAVAKLHNDDLPPRAVALTLDDGYASAGTDAWPMLVERGMPATLFVVPGYLVGDRYFPWDEPGPVARVMTASEVADLHAEGLDIQSHSYEHRWLPTGPDEDLGADLVRSREAIENLLGSAVTGLAYPAGGWDARVRRLAGAAGYGYAVTVDRGINRPGRVSALSLRRSIAPDTADEMAILLDGGYDHLRPLDTLRRRSTSASLPLAGW
jgi:peptidoglycan/xylan/chitin deacetylase (PgdA/CDA1 family)